MAQIYAMPTGIVQFFLKSKGYGYIKIQETNEEIYVAARDLLSPIEKNNLVEFELQENQHGLYATKVQKITH